MMSDNRERVEKLIGDTLKLANHPSVTNDQEIKTMLYEGVCALRLALETGDKHEEICALQVGATIMNLAADLFCGREP